MSPIRVAIIIFNIILILILFSFKPKPYQKYQKEFPFDSIFNSQMDQYHQFTNIDSITQADSVLLLALENAYQINDLDKSYWSLAITYEELNFIDSAIHYNNLGIREYRKQMQSGRIINILLLKHLFLRDYIHKIMILSWA